MSILTILLKSVTMGNGVKMYPILLDVIHGLSLVSEQYQYNLNIFLTKLNPDCFPSWLYNQAILQFDPSLLEMPEGIKSFILIYLK